MSKNCAFFSFFLLCSFAISITISPAFALTPQRMRLHNGNYVLVKGSNKVPAFCLDRHRKPPSSLDVLQFSYGSIHITNGAVTKSLDEAVESGWVVVQGDGSSTHVDIVSLIDDNLSMEISKSSIVATDETDLRYVEAYSKITNEETEIIDIADTYQEKIKKIYGDKLIFKRIRQIRQEIEWQIIEYDVKLDNFYDAGFKSLDEMFDFHLNIGKFDIESEEIHILNGYFPECIDIKSDFCDSASEYINIINLMSNLNMEQEIIIYSDLVFNNFQDLRKSGVSKEDAMRLSNFSPELKNIEKIAYDLREIDDIINCKSSSPLSLCSSTQAEIHIFSHEILYLESTELAKSYQKKYVEKYRYLHYLDPADRHYNMKTAHVSAISEIDMSDDIRKLLNEIEIKFSSRKTFKLDVSKAKSLNHDKLLKFLTEKRKTVPVLISSNDPEKIKKLYPTITPDKISEIINKNKQFIEKFGESNFVDSSEKFKNLKASNRENTIAIIYHNTDESQTESIRSILHIDEKFDLNDFNSDDFNLIHLTCLASGKDLIIKTKKQIDFNHLIDFFIEHEISEEYNTLDFIERVDKYLTLQSVIGTAVIVIAGSSTIGFGAYLLKNDDKRK